MKLFIRNFILRNTLPEYVILLPYRDELLKVIPKFNTAEKILIKNDEFLAYIGKIEKKEILVINTGTGKDNLLLLMKEIIEKGGKYIYLFNKALSLVEIIKIGDIIIPTASAIKPAEKFIISPPVRNIDVIQSLKKCFSKKMKVNSGLSASFSESQIIYLMKDNTLSPEFVNIIKSLKEMNVLGLTTLDYDLLNFAYINEIDAYSILYVVGSVIPESEDNPLKYLDNIFSLFIDYLAQLDNKQSR